MIRRLAQPLIAAALLAVTAGAAAATDFAGTYTGQANGRPMTVVLSADGNAYAGSIRPADASYPLTARAADGQLAGTFAANGKAFAFTATLAGDTLTLTSGRSTYTLARPAAARPAGGLAGMMGGAGRPAAVAAAASSTPADVLELARTDHGRAVALAEPAATSPDAALDAALATLPKVIGGTVTAGDRVADRRHPNCGVAPFRATVDGHAVRGAAFAGPSKDGGMDVSIVYAAADAPPAECRALAAALPHADPPVHPYNFPDGTGSIDLPEGWTCQTASALDTITVNGPNQQSVLLGLNVTFNGPDSPIMQSYAMGMRVWERGRTIPNMPPQPQPQRPEVLMGRFADPLTSLRRMTDQMNAIAKAHGKPEPVHIDQVVATQPAPATLQGGQAAIVLVDTSDAATGGHHRCLMRLESVPSNCDTYMLFVDDLEADRDRFDGDLPTLSAIYKSRHENPDRCQQVGGDRLQQIARLAAIQNQGILERGRMIHDAQADRFNRIEASIHNQQTASGRAAADQAEFLGGQQKYLDTATGQVGYTDYDYSAENLQRMNDSANDPNRFVPVHRRDEQYPLNP